MIKLVEVGVFYVFDDLFSGHVWFYFLWGILASLAVRTMDLSCRLSHGRVGDPTIIIHPPPRFIPPLDLEHFIPHAQLYSSI